MRCETGRSEFKSVTGAKLRERLEQQCSISLQRILIADTTGSDPQGLTPPPASRGPVGLSAQAVEVLQQGVEAPGRAARVQVDAADLLDQLLQRLQLLEPEQQRVVLHQPRRIQERAGGRRLLLAPDQV